MNDLPARRIARAAAALAPPDRAAFLDAACAGDATLRREAEALLQAADDETERLAGPPAPPRDRVIPAVPWSCGPHRAEAEAGRGGTGVVFRGTDTRDGSPVALKVLHPHLVGTADAVARFRRELELGRRVVHENVVRALDAGTAQGPAGPLHVLVTEWADGATLRHLLRELGRVPETLVRETARQVAAGLAAIHAAGAVHRDIKPENVVLAKDGRRARIMDLGIARVVDATQPLTEAGQFLGTLAYAAPEQFEGPSVGPEADLHALGLVMLELLTGVHPFRRDHPAATVRAVLTEVPPRASSLVPEVSDLLDDLIASLLQKDPAVRPGPAALVRDILEEAESGRWWIARRLQAEAPRPPRVPVARETPLRGREADLATLREAWSRARAGHGGTVLIEGEPGLGKSRLLAEFLAESAGTGRLLYGAFPPTRGVGGLVAAVADAFPPGGVEAGLRALLPHAPAVAARLAALVRGDVSRLATPGGAGSVLAGDVAALARALAASGPVTWVLDDLHSGSEEAGLAAVELARVAATTSLLLVVTTRPQGAEAATGALLGMPSVTPLRLPRLSVAQVAALLEDAVGDGGVAERLAPEVARRSDGVPFFAFEMLRGLRETGVLVRDERGAWHVGRPVEEAPIPERLRELVASRLDALEPVERIIVDVAAACGEEFSAPVVARALGLPLVQILQHLARLERGPGLVRAQGRAHRFEHHLVREVAEEALPPALAEQYHGLIADALAEETALRAQDRWRLARHRLAGPRPEAAVDELAAVTDELERASRREQAVELCDVALEREGLLRGAARADVLLRLAALLHVLGRRARQEDAAREALRVAREARDVARQARACFALAQLHVVRHDNEAALAAVRDAVALAGTAGDASLLLEARCHEGVALVNQGRHAEGAAVLNEVVARGTAAGDATREATARLSLGLVALREGRLADARPELERASDLARAERAALLARQADGNLGVLALLENRRDEARERFGRVLDAAREGGDRRMEALACGHLGQAEAEDGRLARALELFARERALAEEIDDRPALASALAECALLRALRGEEAEARQLARDVAVLAPSVPHPRLQAFLGLRLARVAWVLGDLGEALRRLGPGEPAAGGGDHATAAEAHADRAALLLLTGRDAEAREAARRADAESRESGSRGARHLAAAVLVALGDDPPWRDATDAAATREAASWFQALVASLILAAREPGARAEAERLLERAAEDQPEPARRASREVAARMEKALEGR